ncbi:hypothetical protein C8A03DRAFT_16781 [Achaetomium macrosporum]|uniref:Rhodopsin domain-containing protein n=1 Tax=Achaetomium macrosporum TaxID=79813 RepID=A0AAN7C721_9PEZI|nr:hypothetical protein C8A03DRAFT_16781 [Achaetomium macrosporum]
MASQLPPGTDLCAIPAGAPPEGQVPNLVNPDNLHASLIAVPAVMTAWSLIFTTARLYTNKRKLGWADYFVAIAFALSTTYTALVLAMIKYARHQWDTPACWFNATYMKILFAQGVLLGPVIFFAKSAIFLLYLQIFVTGVHHKLRIAIYAGLVLTFLAYWAGVPLEAYFAAPHAGQPWEILLMNGMPERLITWGAVQGSLSVFLDVYIFILPLPPLAKLRLSTRKRVGLLAVFATALMGVIASVIALVFRIRLRTTHDITWVQSCLFICVIVENNVAIIVSSMPAFATFMRVYVSETTFAKSLLSKLGSSKSNGSYDFPTKPSFVKTWPIGGSETWSRTDGSSHNEPPPLPLHNFQFPAQAARADFPFADTTLLTGTETNIRSSPGGALQHDAVKPGGAGIVRTVDIDQELHPASIV